MVLEKGGNPADLATRCGISPQALTDTDLLLPWPRVLALMEMAAAELKAPSFGLEMALAVPRYFPNVGPLVFMAQVVDTMREWARIGVRYWRFHTNAYVAQLLDDGHESDVIFRFRHHPFAAPARQQMELVAANLYRMSQIISPFTETYPTEVHFRHREPLDTTLHRQVFNCPLRFEAEFDEIVFPRWVLFIPTEGRLVALRALVDQYVRYRIRRMPLYNQSFRATVEITMPALMGSGACNAESVAKSFGMSAKKLQRLLAQEGTTFSEILDEVRRTMACRFLKETRIPVQNIAGWLEYSGAPAFIMAFKRWTGVTPSEFRSWLLTGGSESLSSKEDHDFSRSALSN